MQTLVFNFDGTRNGRSDVNPTNVFKFHRAVKRTNQVSFYFAGPGDEDDGDWWDQLLGSALGVGSLKIRDEAVSAFDAVYQPGDVIMVEGFSRGAMIARKFCQTLTDRGHEVEFLGLFDTVAAFLPFGKSQQATLFGNLHVSPKVLNVYHAVALNENRKAFVPNLVNWRKGVTEVWFKGNHADIGGGYAEIGLSDITLGWMMKAATRHGLQFNPIELHPDSTQDVHYEDAPMRRAPRIVGVKMNDNWDLTKTPMRFEEDLKHA